MAESQVTTLRKEEGDDTSFIRTVSKPIKLFDVLGYSGALQEDVVCLLCSSGDGMKRGYLAADGFGSQFCYLEAEAREEVRQYPTTGPHLCMNTIQITRVHGLLQTV